MSTDWIREGARVAEYDRRTFDATITFATISRLTATQIVLDNGNRYRRDNQRIVGSGREELLPLDDDRVRNTVAASALKDVRYGTDRLCKDHRGGVSEVLSTLDEIARLVAEARAKVEG